MVHRRKAGIAAGAIVLLLALAQGAGAEGGPSPRPPASELDRALTRAAAGGDLEGVRAALDGGADIDSRDGIGSRGTALDKAAAEGHVATVELLLARGATVHFTERSGLYAAHGAGVDGHTDVIRVLVAHARPEDLDAALSSALVAAAWNGHVDTVAYLLDLGVDVDAVPARENMPTAFEAATDRGRVELAGSLLDRGAQVRVLADRGVPAAEGAAAHGDLELLQRILDAVVSEEEPRVLYGPALAQACRVGHGDAAALLLAYGADPDYSGSRGLIFYNPNGGRFGAAPLPPLTFAAEYARWDVVDLLLDAGADPERGELLQLAASWGNLGLVRRLLVEGVDIQTEGRTGNALTTLAQHPRGTPADVQATAQLLLEAGIDPDVPFDGRRPLGWALEHGDAELARVLEEGGASANTTFAYKLRQLRKSIAGAALVAALMLGGSM